MDAVTVGTGPAVVLIASVLAVGAYLVAVAGRGLFAPVAGRPGLWSVVHPPARGAGSADPPPVEAPNPPCGTGGDDGGRRRENRGH